MQMDESQAMPIVVATCLLQLAVPDDSIAGGAGVEPAAKTCDGLHEVCVQLERGSRHGVCDCAEGYYRSKPGTCASELQRSEQLLHNDLQSGVGTATVPTPSTTTASPSSANHPLTVSVLSKDVRLPEREVSLAAYTISDDIGAGTGTGTAYRYQWSLISQPGGDVNGTMSDNTKDTIHLTNLSEGQYRFKVLVTGDNRTGEAYANVTVSPQKRINRAPQVQITPAGQTVKLPTSQAILDGSASTDDDRIAGWHWDLIQGPIGYHPQLPEISTLQLADLTAPGNYTFRLTLTDSDGASNSSTATITVLKANDYPPEANAGSDVILYLPANHVTLNGSLSTDDREITRWEWTKDASVVSKAVDMQNTSTPFVELSNLQEGIYAFKLRVSDASNQTSTASVHVFVKAALANRAPRVSATVGVSGTVNGTVVLPQTWVELNGTAVSDERTVRYEWQQVSGPAGVQWSNVDRPTTNATHLTVGVYVLRLTCWSEGGLNGSADVWVTVRQERNAAPVANAGGDQTMVMPLKQIVLNGTRSTDDLGIVQWSWTRDGSSLAIGTVMGSTDREPVMIVSIGVVCQKNHHSTTHALTAQQHIPGSLRVPVARHRCAGRHRLGHGQRHRASRSDAALSRRTDAGRGRDALAPVGGGLHAAAPAAAVRRRHSAAGARSASGQQARRGDTGVLCGAAACWRRRRQSDNGHHAADGRAQC